LQNPNNHSNDCKAQQYDDIEYAFLNNAAFSALAFLEVEDAAHVGGRGLAVVVAVLPAGADGIKDESLGGFVGD